MTGEDRSPDLRASHEDRDRVVEQLRVAAGDGRLTLEELDERLEVALTARTGGELAALLTDLPVTADPVAPAAKDLIVIECDKTSLARAGAWTLPRALEVRIDSGSLTLDLTEAVITRPTLRIDAGVRTGSLKIITRPGIVLDLDDVSVRAGAITAPPHRASAAPVELRVEISGSVYAGSIQVRHRKPRRRGFLAWLLRRPLPAAGAMEKF